MNMRRRQQSGLVSIVLDILAQARQPMTVASVVWAVQFRGGRWSASAIRLALGTLAKQGKLARLPGKRIRFGVRKAG